MPYPIVILSNVTVFLCLVCSLSVCRAQSAPNDNTMNARDAFWSAVDLVPPPPPKPVVKLHQTPRPLRPPPPPDPATQHPLGLRYSVLKQQPDKTFQEVSPSSEFKVGDKLCMSLMSTREGYLYVIEQGSSGAWISLYPKPGISGTNHIIPGQEYLVPDGKDTWTIANPPGDEKLFVLLTSNPELDLERVISSLKTHGASAQDASISDSLLSQVRTDLKSRDIVVTSAEDDNAAPGPKDQATYVFTDPHIIVDVKLSHPHY